MGVNRHPFVKDKWDERAYFLVQDVLYEGMEDGHVSVNAGISDLAILAFIRATCSRPGALLKDWFDMSGAVAKWARVGGEETPRTPRRNVKDTQCTVNTVNKMMRETTSGARPGMTSETPGGAGTHTIQHR